MSALKTAASEPLTWTPLALAAICLGLLALRPDWLMALVVAVVCLLAGGVCWLNVKIRRLSKQHYESEKDKQLLIESIECAPLAFAVYDPDDKLLAWNKSYEKFYPKAFKAYRQQPGAPSPHYSDLLKESAPSDMPEDKVSDYIAQRVHDQKTANGTPIDRHYPQTGWSRVTKFVTPNGAIAGFAVDINALKAQETALQTEIKRRRAIETELKRLASTDSLTDAMNRRAFMACVASEIARFKRYEVPACLVLLDVDWFKAINDKFGHQMGDEVLAAMVDVAKESTRGNIDKIGRIGGEEFGLLLPHTNLAGGRTCAELLRKRIAALALQSVDGTRISVTASLGVSELKCKETTLTRLIGEADQAMYESKAKGRNRVSVFTPVGRRNTSEALHPSAE